MYNEMGQLQLIIPAVKPRGMLANHDGVFLFGILLQEYTSFVLPHHLKSVAKGRPVIMVPLVLFTDDTSGNKSKQWNKFDYWVLRIAGLPIKENSMLHNNNSSSLLLK